MCGHLLAAYIANFADGKNLIKQYQAAQYLAGIQ